MNKRPALLATAGAAALVLAAGGIAFASVPDTQGVIHGCYDTGGNLKIIDTSVTPSCPKGYSALSWSQAGTAGSQGPQGTQGPAGPAGATGPAGSNGTNGSTVLSGTLAPSNSVGNDGDFYIDTATDMLYGPKAGGAWPTTGTSLIGTPGAPGATGATGPQGPAGPAGQQGAAGTNGNTVLNGTGAPTASVGNDGDFYVDTAADQLYGPKAGGTWPASGTSLTGSPGTGAKVATEPAGANCANGGAKVTDGTGDTAYACDGASGPSSAPVGASIVYGTQNLTVTAFTGATQIPGLANMVIVPANSLVYVSAQGGANTESEVADGFSVITVGLFVDGRYAGPGGGGLTDQVTMMNNAELVEVAGHWSLSAVLQPGAGTHIFQVEAAGEGIGSTALVGGAGSNEQGALSVLVMPQ